jgi:hypothetical protein
MLNNATLLLKMRDAIARLMDKCEKITKKMAALVEQVALNMNMPLPFMLNMNMPFLP